MYLSHPIRLEEVAPTPVAKRQASAPPRPALPPLLLMALGLWGATASVTSFCIDFQAEDQIALGVAAAFGLMGAFVVLKKSSTLIVKNFALVVLGLSLGIANGLASLYLLTGQVRAVEAQQGGALYTFEVTEDVRDGSYGLSCLAKTTLADGTQIQVCLNGSDEGFDVSFGDVFVARTFLTLPDEPSRHYYFDKRVVAIGKITSFEKRERSDLFGAILSFRSKAIEIISAPETKGTSFLRAILFGDRKDLNKDGFYQDIRVVGLAHLVAVSGAHLVIVTSSIGFFLHTIRARRSLVVSTQIAFVVMYLIFTAMPISAMRAACMAIVSALSFYAGRRSSSLNAFSICLLIILVTVPGSALSISFLLSAFSTLGIIMLNPLFGTWVDTVLRVAPSFVKESLSMTLAASLLIIPLSGALFSQVSLLSPLSNVVATPFLTFLCVFGLFGVSLSLMFPPLGSVVLPPLFLVANAFVELVERGARLPYASIPFKGYLVIGIALSLLCLGVLWFRWPKPSKQKVFITAVMGFFCCALFTLLPALLSEDEVIMFDVGQGDAFLVRSGGVCVLIDTGNHDADLLKGLARQGIYDLDAVLISHADDDHCGSLEVLRGTVGVKRVCVSQETLDCVCSSCQMLVSQAEQLVGNEQIFPLCVGDHLSVGKFDLEVLWPRSFIDSGSNADSLCLVLSMPKGKSEKPLEEDYDNSWKILFCGDAEKNELATVIAEKSLNDIDILKVGHHGSLNSLSEEVLSVLQPKIALISVGANNRYGHPADKILSLLNEVSCRIYRSDKEGDVVCKLSLEAIRIEALG